MNYIKHLSGFFEKVSKDDRLNPSHVSLYISLFQFWNSYRFHNPISISRQEAMKVSKIASKVTYHKCIRELNDFGYLRYVPSYNPFKGSLVYLFDFQTNSELVNKINKLKNKTGTEQVANSNHQENGTGSEQALIPYTNTTNNSKQKTEVNEIFKFKKDENYTDSKNDSTTNDSSEKEKKVAPKKRKPGAVRETRSEKETEKGSQVKTGNSEQKFSPGTGSKRPLRADVHSYFQYNNWPAKEADKFYNHYESNGWLVGGKTPMQNWQASADNWILNSEKFADNKAQSNADRSVRPGKLHATNNKDYDEPL